MLRGQQREVPQTDVQLYNCARVSAAKYRHTAARDVPHVTESWEMSCMTFSSPRDAFRFPTLFGSSRQHGGCKVASTTFELERTYVSRILYTLRT